MYLEETKGTQQRTGWRTSGKNGNFTTKWLFYNAGIAVKHCLPYEWELRSLYFSPGEVLPMSSSLPPSASLSNVSRIKSFLFNLQVIFHFLEYRNVSANSEKEGWPLTWRIAMQYFFGVFGQLTSLSPGGRASWSSPPGASPPSAPARPPAIRWQL